MAEKQKTEPDGVVDVRGRRGKDGFEVVVVRRKSGALTEEVVRASGDRRIAGDALGAHFIEAFR